MEKKTLVKCEIQIKQHDILRQILIYIYICAHNFMSINKLQIKKKAFFFEQEI